MSHSLELAHSGVCSACNTWFQTMLLFRGVLIFCHRRTQGCHVKWPNRQTDNQFMLVEGTFDPQPALDLAEGDRDTEWLLSDSMGRSEWVMKGELTVNLRTTMHFFWSYFNCAANGIFGENIKGHLVTTNIGHLSLSLFRVLCLLIRTYFVWQWMNVWYLCS